MSPSSTPVPVPKDSLFKVKTSVDESKGKVKVTASSPTPGGKTLIGIDLLPKKVLKQDDGTIIMTTVLAPPEVKIQPVTIPVIIPPELWHAIMSKPSTGGGWQTLMGELKKVTASAGDLQTYTVTLTPALLGKVIDKAVIGSGGYQSVLRWIVCLAVKQHLQPSIVSSQMIAAIEGKGGAS